MIHPQYVANQIGTFDLHTPDGPADGAVLLSFFNCDDEPLSGDWTQKTAVSVDAYSQVLTASAEEDARSVVVGDSAALYQGRRMWLENEFGSGEEVIVDGQLDGVVNLANSLTYAHNSAATPKPVLKSHLYRSQVPADVLDTEQRDAYAFWAWQHKGAWRYLKVPFDVIRTPWHVPVAANDIRKVQPAIIRHAGGRSTWAPLLEGAQEHVEMGLYSAQVKPDLVLTSAMFIRLVCLKLAHTWMLQKDALNQDELTLLNKREKEYLNCLALVVDGELRPRKRKDFLAMG